MKVQVSLGSVSGPAGCQGTGGGLAGVRVWLRVCAVGSVLQSTAGDLACGQLWFSFFFPLLKQPTEQ